MSDAMYSNVNTEFLNKLKSYIKNKIEVIKMDSTKQGIDKTCDAMKEFLIEKNRRYGDSALNPLTVFSKHIHKENSQALNGMLVRLDDKLKRVVNSDKLRENDVIDIIGYLMLVCVERGWNDFTHHLD